VQHIIYSESKMRYHFNMEKLSFFEIEDWEEEYIKKALSAYNCQFTSESLSEKNVESFNSTTILSTMLYSVLDPNMLSKLPNLKMIATRTTGFDHIDLNYCKQRGIVVCNVPSYGETTVAEHTFALILALSRNIVQSAQRTRRGNFSLDGLEGFDIADKTIGVIGLGHIGKRVAQIALGFKMKVIVYAHKKDEDLAQNSNVYFINDLDLLFARSDIITLHIPASPENNHIINLDNIAKFKKGSLLINTSRGSLIDTQAIVYGLEKKILRGVGLDVVEDEAIVKEERAILTQNLKPNNLETLLLNHVLLGYENVIITPHNAFNSHEALKTILDTTVMNIRGFLEDKLQNKIDQP